MPPCHLSATATAPPAHKLAQLKTACSSSRLLSSHPHRRAPQNFRIMPARCCRTVAALIQKLFYILHERARHAALPLPMPAVCAGRADVALAFMSATNEESINGNFIVYGHHHDRARRMCGRVLACVCVYAILACTHSRCSRWDAEAKVFGDFALRFHGTNLCTIIRAKVCVFVSSVCRRPDILYVCLQCACMLYILHTYIYIF